MIFQVVAQEREDAKLTEEERAEVNLRRTVNTSILLTQSKYSKMKEYLSDTRVQRARQHFEKGEFGQAFIDLYQQAQVSSELSRVSSYSLFISERSTEGLRAIRED